MLVYRIELLYYKEVWYSCFLDACCGVMEQASCTLDAGVLIYSKRVDSIHSDTFKVRTETVAQGK